MKASSVYFRGSDIYVIASARTVRGILEDAEPFFKLPRSASPRELGEKVIEALAAFREGVPGKTFVRGVKPPPDPFLAFAGFKSWGAFERGTRHFSVSTTGSDVQITPSSAAPQGGHLYEPEKAVRVPAQAEKIGQALLEQAAQPA